MSCAAFTDPDASTVSHRPDQADLQAQDVAPLRAWAKGATELLHILIIIVSQSASSSRIESSASQLEHGTALDTLAEYAVSHPHADEVLLQNVVHIAPHSHWAHV